MHCVLLPLHEWHAAADLCCVVDLHAATAYVAAVAHAAVGLANGTCC
jgi:hypothetical protein